MRLAPLVMTSFNRAFRRWSAPPAVRHAQREPASPATRKSVMLLRAKFLLEEVIAVRTGHPALLTDSAAG